ncbi:MULTISPECIES: RteC domain-containing protein [Flavobacteriales]|uniref:Tetracycline regulation of excision, RteC n=2 Tax=Bacteroidota TaxID=976 RepID=A0A124F2X6_9FLAO|nr:MULTISPECIES: RteC domain-containing protein [Flavobacteriales]KUJ56160.1 tetracycline regulation of excision, RteC [Chryseobacterium aquaticum subsp. greenlandense]
MKYSLHKIIDDVSQYESKIVNEASGSLDEALKMISYLQEVLTSLKASVVKEGFESEWEEINFFRNVKPGILGKLIYYNKVYRIECACPLGSGKIYRNYFSNQIKELKQEFEEHIFNSEFYRYYRSGRNDRDQTFFRLGNINLYDGLNSFVFEIDHHFSTYYDYKVARIIANDLLQNYLHLKIDSIEDCNFKDEEATKDIFWTSSKNALVELIYAMYASGAVSHGKVGIRKLSMIAQIVFSVSLGDLHHAFHRMKTRAGSRTAFLDHLKISLEEYMDKDL